MSEGADPPVASAADAGDEAGLIASDEAIASCVAAFGAEVAVDTEFVRTRTFHPIPALYQLAGDDGARLVDATAPVTFDALKALLADAERTKVMHACSEDLEVFAHHLNVRPQALVDTQVAHAFLAPDLSASYASVVEDHLGIRIDKKETRSNWLRRPLSSRQLAYARADVIHLPAIWRRQRDALAAAARLPWFEEEMRRVLARVPPSALPPECWYRHIRGAWRLKSGELAVLRSLAAWREREARRRDLPRAWTVRDDALLALARRPQLDADDVAKTVPGRPGRRYAAAIVDAHQRGLRDDDPPRRAPRPLGPRGSQLAASLRAIVAREAQRLNVAPALLAGKRDVETALRHHREHGALPERFNCWRLGVLGDAFHAVLAEGW